MNIPAFANRERHFGAFYQGWPRAARLARFDLAPEFAGSSSARDGIIHAPRLASRRLSPYHLRPMADDFKPKSDFLRVLMERGFVHQCSDFPGLDEKAAAGGLSAYIGFDCTAPSLHVGSLLPIMMLAWLQRSGGRPLPL
ncbi:MAG: hypothetical protein ACM3NE_06540, partial [Hyphomicrobiales bacterium]